MPVQDPNVPQYTQPPITGTVTTPVVSPTGQGGADPVQSGARSQDVSQETYGKVIPLSVGGRRLMGGYIVWGPYTRDVLVGDTTVRYADFAVSFGYSAAPDGIRDLLEIHLDTRLAFSLIRNVGMMRGLNFRFYPGTETQLSDPLAVAKHGDEADAFRGQMVLFFENMLLDAFDNLVPFVSALICDRMSSGPAVSFFDTPTASTVRSIFAPDWAGDVVYSHGRSTDYRLLAHRISDRSQVSDVAISNLAAGTVFDYLEETQFLWAPEFGVIFAMARNTRFHGVVALDPDSATILAETDSLLDLLFSTDGNPGAALAYGVDTSVPASPLGVIVHSDFTFDRIHVNVYDPQAVTITNIEKTGNDIDGLASGITAVVKKRDSSRTPNFLIAASDELVLCDVDANDGSVEFSVVYTASASINNVYALNGGSCVLFLSDGTAVRLDRNYDEVWITTPGFTVPSAEAVGGVYANMEGWRRTRPYFPYFDGSALTLLDLTTGTAGAAQSIAATTGHILFDSERMQTIITDNADPRVLGFSGSSDDTIAKSDALEILAAFHGYSSDEFECVGLTGTWIALIIAYETTFQDELRRIADVEGWDVIESGDKIKVVQKVLGSSMVVDKELTDRDIVGGPASIETTIEEEVEHPRVYELHFLDPARDYNWNKADYVFAAEPLPVTASVAAKVFKLPIVMEMNEAKLTIAAKAHRDRMARASHTFPGMPSTMNLEPSDLITLPTGFGTKTCKVADTDSGAEFSSKIRCHSLLKSGPIFDPAIWVPGIFPVDPGERPPDSEVPQFPQDPSLIGFMLDTPILRFDHELDPESERLRIYGAGTPRASGVTAPFAVFELAAQGLYQLLTFGFTGANATCGALLNALGDTATPHQTDYVNSMTVKPIAGAWASLSDQTYLQLCNETQLFAVGKTGRWEIISAGDVTANADGTYTLATLLRGLYGSEVFCGDHAVGDHIVMITGRLADHWSSDLDSDGAQLDQADSGILRTGLNANLLGKEVVWQLVPLRYHHQGTFPAPGLPVYYATIQGTAEKPFAPCHLDAAVDGSDIDLTWDRRDRLDELGLHDGDGDVPMSEASELYDVEIMDGVTVTRLYEDVTTTAKTYPAADITADFGSLPASLTFRVYQKSAVVGRGFRAQATITL